MPIGRLAARKFVVCIQRFEFAFYKFEINEFIFASMLSSTIKCKHDLHFGIAQNYFCEDFEVWRLVAHKKYRNGDAPNVTFVCPLGHVCMQ